MRIYELAKELGKTSKELLEELRQQGLEIKSHMSAVDEKTVQRMREIAATKTKKKPEAGAEKRPPKEKEKPEAKAGEKASAKTVEAKEKPEKKAKKTAETKVEAGKPPVKAKTEARARVKEPPGKAEKETKTEVRIEAENKPAPEEVKEEEPIRKTVEAPSAATVEELPKETTERTMVLEEAITVKELAEKLDIKSNEVITTLMKMGIMANINQVLDFDTARQVVEKFGIQVTMAGQEIQEETVAEEEEKLEPRPPVVTVMGHVDHGKTRLLDAIRETKVVEKEMGGITQHIGASVVEMDDAKIVFLDTPGHEAFTTMRARGAQVTDIVVLVVAADDGVMPQTREAIAHARAANVPIVVAINKIDKPEARPDRVKQQLAEQGLIPEEWGGETIFCEVSAKEKTGIDNLLEMILLQAEIMELKANPHRRARGTIIEAKLDKGRGPVSTVLVQEGTLKVGNSFVCGLEYGRVRAMLSSKGKRIEEATPSIPVEVLGLSDVPKAGDIFQVVEEERKARQISLLRQQKNRDKTLAGSTRITLEDLYKRIAQGAIKELNVVLKADVHGSLQAITESLEKLSTDEVKVTIMHGSVGGIRETDVALASASEAVIIGFNVRPAPKASEMAEREGVDIRLYSVIYDLISDVKNAMEGLLEPLIKEVVLGRIEIREIFNISKIGLVAGGYVIDGLVRRDSRIRVIRDDIVIYEGKVGSLKRFKDDVREVSSGYECGISVEGYNDLKRGDILEPYELQEVSKKL